MDLEDKAERAARLKKEKEKAAAQKKKEAEEKKKADQAKKEQAAAAKKIAAEEKKNKKLFEKQRKENAKAAEKANAKKGGFGAFLLVIVSLLTFVSLGSNIFFYINAMLHPGEDGKNGEVGDIGVSGEGLYDEYKKYHNKYLGDYQSFYDDFNNKKLFDTITIRVDLTEDADVADRIVNVNILYREGVVITEPKSKTGRKFSGWANSDNNINLVIKDGLVQYNSGSIGFIENTNIIARWE